MAEKHDYQRKQTVIIKADNLLDDDLDDEDDSSDGDEYDNESSGNPPDIDENEDNTNQDNENNNENDNENDNDNDNDNVNENVNENENENSSSGSKKHGKKDSLAPPSGAVAAGFNRRKSSSSMVAEQIQSLMASREKGKSKNPLEEMEREMEELNQDRQLFTDLFDKIDSSGNGDLDLNEWLDSLSKVGVVMNNEDKETIFKYMDIEGNEYVQKDDFVGFCIQTFRSEKLTQLQDELIAQIRGQVHSRQPSNLVRADTQEQWDEIEMHAMHKEMSQHIVNLATDLTDSIDKEEKFYEEIERRAQESPDFAKVENAPNWNPQEVAWWLDSIDFGAHARKFFDDSVDGSILLNDIDQNFLSHEFGIKQLHVKKILREIDKLRKLNSHDLETPYKDWHQLSRENEKFIEQLNAANTRIKELETENVQLKLTVAAAANGSHMNLLGSGADGNINAFNQMGSNIYNPLAGLVNMKTNDNGMQVGIVTTDTGTIIDPLSDDFKTGMVSDKDAFIQALINDIKSLHYSKIKLVENTDLEIQSLRKIIKALSGEYQTLRTPMYKKIHPLDSVMGFLGYQAADD